MRIFSLSCFLILSHICFSQTADRWQQRAEYNMNIDFDVSKHQFTGEQVINYYNNSPDTLTQVFYHLYFNAFQANSMMDVRSRTIPDPDGRVSSRIFALDETEIGFQKVNALTQDGLNTSFEVVGTILEVQLAQPIYPGQKTVLAMSFEAQVPVQIRRSGRDNTEGVDYSMAQWYPKLSEYDYQGWHANPYVGREFHGVWGDFDVKINIDENYVIAASGVLQNPQEVGGDYAPSSAQVKVVGGKKRWHFIAENVHDFAWGSDRDYKIVQKKAYNGTNMIFAYIPSERTNENWEKLPDIMSEALRYLNERFGTYPFPVYNFVQGGDGGMEYPMLTLITGERRLGSLVGVSVHEWVHSWFQMVLGTNESLYSWMDEGFTTFASAETMNYLKEKGLLGESKAVDNPHESNYNRYYNFISTGLDEALSTHADHYQTNSAYGTAAYSKGGIFLRQLEYIIGEEVFASGMLRYFNTWKFKHPNPNDFIRVMEKESGMELDWYKEYWINSTHHPDYAIYAVEPVEDKYKIIIVKDGVMPMPLDVEVQYMDGTSELINIPLQIMRGEKKMDGGRSFIYRPDWPWTHPVYTLVVDKVVKEVKIDPDHRMTDTNRDNNAWILNP